MGGPLIQGARTEFNPMQLTFTYLSETAARPFAATPFFYSPTSFVKSMTEVNPELTVALKNCGLGRLPRARSTLRAKTHL